VEKLRDFHSREIKGFQFFLGERFYTEITEYNNVQDVKTYNYSNDFKNSIKY